MRGVSMAVSNTVAFREEVFRDATSGAFSGLQVSAHMRGVSMKATVFVPSPWSRTRQSGMLERAVIWRGTRSEQVKVACGCTGWGAVVGGGRSGCQHGLENPGPDQQEAAWRREARGAVGCRRRRLNSSAVRVCGPRCALALSVCADR